MMVIYKYVEICFIFILSVVVATEEAPTNNTTTEVSVKSQESIHVAGFDYHTVKSPLVYTIILLLAGLSKIVYHYANFLSAKFPESSMLIVLGTIFGAIIHFSGAAEHLPLFFAPHAFFLFLLPPIVLEAAYSLHDPTFADNLGTVLLFAVLGTVLACFFLGLTLYGLIISGAMGELPMPMSLVQIFVFSSLIVAVDPVAVLAVFSEVGVNHVLYFVLFGESLLNDGVTVVLYKVMQNFNKMDTVHIEDVILGIVKFLVVCFGGLFLGILAGICSAVLTRFTTKAKVLQPLVIYAVAYLGFLLSELFEFSGIISLMGCGLTQAHYAFHNISDHSRTTVKYFTKAMSSACEIVIFMFLGLALVREDHVWHTGFVLWTVVFCLLYRFIIVFGMTFFINRYDRYRVRKIGLDEQFMIAYGGLRGAVCFSLVALLQKDEIPMKNMFVTTTLFVIMFTVLIQGVTIKPLVSCFQVQLAPEKNLSMSNELNSHVIHHLMAGIEDIIGFRGKYHFKEFLEQFEEKYLLCWLQKHPNKRDTAIKSFYDQVVLKEHYRYLTLSGVKTLPHESHIPKIATEIYLPDMAKASTNESVRSSAENTINESYTSTSGHLDAKDLRNIFSPTFANRMFLHNVYNRTLVIEEPQQTLKDNITDKALRNRRLQEKHIRPRSQSEPKVPKRNAVTKNRTVTIDLGDAQRQGIFIPDAESSAADHQVAPELLVPPSTPEDKDVPELEASPDHEFKPVSFEVMIEDEDEGDTDRELQSYEHGKPTKEKEVKEDSSDDVLHDTRL